MHNMLPKEPINIIRLHKHLCQNLAFFFATGGAESPYRNLLKEVKVLQTVKQEGKKDQNLALVTNDQYSSIYSFIRTYLEFQIVIPGLAKSTPIRG